MPRPREQYGPSDQVPLNWLVPGVVVRRHTEPAGTGRVETKVPCCDRWAPIRIGASDDRTVIGCRTCDRVYAAALWDENDGGFTDGDTGYLAILTVQAERITWARRKPRKPLGRQHGSPESPRGPLTSIPDLSRFERTDHVEHRAEHRCLPPRL